VRWHCNRSNARSRQYSGVVRATQSQRAVSSKGWPVMDQADRIAGNYQEGGKNAP
jgi:hypothetical protein